MRLLALATAMVVLSSAAAFGEDVSILTPNNDQITLTPTIEVSGSAVVDPGGSTVVNVRVNGKPPKMATVQGGVWKIPDLPLDLKHNVVIATLGSVSRTIAVTRTPDAIGNRGRQQVFFKWRPGVDAVISDVAKDTLETPPNATELAQFVLDVKKRTVEIYKERFQAWNVVVIDAPAANMHTVLMMPNSDSVFGQSPFDCGSGTSEQTSEVHVGTYHSSMVDEFDEWRPMNRNDSIAVRVEDLSQALSRTAAHETSHSLGLVGEDGEACGWMNGCDGGHSCSLYDLAHPEVDRFDSGWYIMDPGGKTLNIARLGEPSPNDRAVLRVAPIFNAFNRAYLSIVHPHP